MGAARWHLFKGSAVAIEAGMFVVPMAVAKKKPSTKPAKPVGRKKSKLTKIGEEAMRAALLKALKQNGWSITRTAEALEMAGSANVLRSIKLLGLDDEYEQARIRGDVRPGPKPE